MHTLLSFSPTIFVVTLLRWILIVRLHPVIVQHQHVLILIPITAISVDIYLLAILSVIVMLRQQQPQRRQRQSPQLRPRLCLRQL